ncbi:flagellar assembly protein FliW [Bacillus tianshenii]|nr:flagellar assembly protein FliW [Bacillus tianshenii]
MQLQTKYNGEVQVKQEDILHFNQGLPSFEEETEFILLPFAEGSPFLILQSTKTKELAFVLVNPFDFFQDYQVKIEDAVKEQLEINNRDEVMILVLLTLQEPFKKTTANLQGPLIINVAKKLAKQVILNTSNYQTKHYLFPQQPSKVQEGK